MPSSKTTSNSLPLPADRREAMDKLRTVINQYIDKGYEERLAPGIISYVVPHSAFPAGYHCDPKMPLGYMQVVSQKNVISIHHMGLYGSGELMKWFTDEYPKHTMAKLDIGKACVRFKNPDDIPYDLIGQLAGKMSVKKWIAIYEKGLQMAANAKELRKKGTGQKK